MNNFPGQYFQDIYYVMSLITSQKWREKVKWAEFYDIESSHEDLNFCKFFNMLLATDIFSSLA